MPKLLPISCCVCLCLCGFFISGCGEPTPASAIERVLNDCAEISQSANNSQFSAAEAAYYVATKQQEVDVRDCPIEFRQVYQEHVNAWKRAAYALPSDVLMETVVEVIIGGASGHYGMIGQSYRDVEYAFREINETYYRLVQIAASYGARVPRSEVSL